MYHTHQLLLHSIIAPCRRVLLIAALAVAGVSSYSAHAINARQIFINDELNLFEIIPANMRIEMLSYLDAGIVRPAKNIFGGSSTITRGDSNMVNVNIAPGVDIDVWVPDTISTNGIVVVNRSYSLPASDGNIRVIDAYGSVLKNAFTAPTVSDFISVDKSSALTASAVQQIIDMGMISYSIDAVAAVVTATLDIKNYLSPADYDRVKPYVKSELKYKLSGKRFKLVK